MKSEASPLAQGAQTGQLSWFDGWKAFIQRLRVPVPLVYLLAAAVSVGLFALNAWLTLGWPGSVFEHPFLLVLALGPVYALALMHLLDVRAGRALSDMRSFLTPPEAYPSLRDTLVTLPARRAWQASLVGLLVGLTVVSFSRIALPAPFQFLLVLNAARLFVEIWLALSWFVIAALLYHTLRQLSEINRIYTGYVIIDLDNYQPLFHFSKVSGITAVGLLVIPYSWNATIPNLLHASVGVLFGILFLAFGAVAFLWPLVGARNLIAEAKSRALEENARVLKEARDRLYRGATRGDLTGAGEIGDALAAIRAEREALLNIPTWPWAPGTIRSVMAALALPVAIWLLQFALERLIGA